MCRSKRINEVYEEEDEQGQHDDEFDRGFLGSISIHELESQGDPWKVKLKIANILATFKLELHVLGVIDAKLTAGHGRETTQQV